MKKGQDRTEGCWQAHWFPIHPVTAGCLTVCYFTTAPPLPKCLTSLYGAIQPSLAFYLCHSLRICFCEVCHVDEPLVVSTSSWHFQAPRCCCLSATFLLSISCRHVLHFLHFYFRCSANNYLK